MDDQLGMDVRSFHGNLEFLDAARVVGVVDHRHEDDSGADFERAQDMVTLTVGQADQGEDAACLGGEA